MRYEEEAGRTRSRSRSRSPKSFRGYIAELLLKNNLSGAQTQRVSSLSLNTEVADLAKAGKSGEISGNISRDLMRKLSKDVRAPSPYFAEVLTHDPKTGRNRVPVLLPFLLAHEMLDMLTSRNGDIIKNLATLSGDFARLRDDFCRTSGSSAKGMIGLGFHGDGVPHQKIHQSMFSLGTHWSRPLRTGCSSPPYRSHMFANAVVKEGVH